MQNIMKKCTKCGVEKELTDFYPRKDRPCRICSVCKKCNNDYHKTDIAVEKRKIYNTTEAAKLKYSRFSKTDKGKLIRKNYKHSEKGIENRLKEGRLKVELIADRYVKEKLKAIGFKTNSINENPILIDTYKIIIKTKRLCKTSKNLETI